MLFCIKNIIVRNQKVYEYRKFKHPDEIILAYLLQRVLCVGLNVRRVTGRFCQGTFLLREEVPVAPLAGGVSLRS